MYDGIGIGVGVGEGIMEDDHEEEDSLAARLCSLNPPSQPNYPPSPTSHFMSYGDVYGMWDKKGIVMKKGVPGGEGLRISEELSHIHSLFHVYVSIEGARVGMPADEVGKRHRIVEGGVNRHVGNLYELKKTNDLAFPWIVDIGKGVDVLGHVGANVLVGEEWCSADQVVYQLVFWKKNDETSGPFSSSARCGQVLYGVVAAKVIATSRGKEHLLYETYVCQEF
ncbi:hypothetical protein EON65_46770 [archaeon]|nr:MAG: hypothetical protein EON65_46770 [archaeon]